MEDNKLAISEEEIKEKLQDFPGWRLEGNKIVKEFKLNSFVAVLNLINSLAPFFEKNDHHPDMHISYKNITFELTRYDIGGRVTQNDFIAAREIEDKFIELSKQRENK
jgi:4a-hydroxytetrahydrobiopterin dehydratase